MADENEKFFDGKTIFAIIAVIVCIPYVLYKIVTSNMSRTNKVLCLIATAPSVLCGLFYIGILAVSPIVFMFVCLDSDAWPLGVAIGFFIFVVVKGLIDRLSE